MDTGKLLKVINDIQKEEAKLELQNKLQNILNYYNQNDPSSVNTEKENIKQSVLESRISEYAKTDFEVLEKMEVVDYFGPGLYQALENILSKQAHEVKQELEKFINERSEKLSAVENLMNSLGGFGFESRALDENQYEIGFTLPEEYKELQKTESVLKDMKLFLNALAEATDTQQPLKIKYVSNGTLQLFIEANLELAQHFDVVLDYALKIYASIKGYEDIKKRYVNFSSRRKKRLEKETEDEKQENTNKLVDELIKKLVIKTPDQENRVRELFILLLKHLEKGLGAEVVTPTLEPPVKPGDETDTEKKKGYRQAKKLYEAKKTIDARNREIFILQQNNFYGMDTKFLNQPKNNRGNKK